MEYQLIIFGVVMIAFVGIVVWLMNKKAAESMKEMQSLMNTLQQNRGNELLSFQQQMGKQMLDYQNTMTNSIQNEMLRMMQHNTAQLSKMQEQTQMQLARFDQRVSSGVMKSMEQTNQSFVSMKEEMVRIQRSQVELEKLQGSIRSLQDILNDKKTRGIYGEVELYSLMKQVYGLDESKWMKQVRLSNGSIADCVLFAPDPLGNIVIDSKFPLENYNRICNETDETLLAKAKANFRNDLKKHVQDISSKYLIEGETAVVAYMFVPAESVFAEIYARFQDVVQFAYEKNVYIVSPTTLMAYLTAMKAIYLGMERNDKAEMIQLEYGKLAKEFERFEKRYALVYQDFERTYKDMQDIMITHRKINTRFKEIADVKLEDLDD